MVLPPPDCVAESRFGVKTMVIAADFSKGQSVFEDIEAKLKEIPVGILGKHAGQQVFFQSGSRGNFRVSASVPRKQIVL